MTGRHRSRASAACLACRKSRIRCAIGQADTSCVNCRETGSECRFDTRDGRKERASAKAVTESLAKRVHQLEELLRSTQPVPGPRDGYLDSLASAMPANRVDNVASGLTPEYLRHSSSVPMLDDSGMTTAAEEYFNDESKAFETATPSIPAANTSAKDTTTSSSISISSSSSSSPPAVTNQYPDRDAAAAASLQILASTEDRPPDISSPGTTTDTASVVRSLVPSPIRFDMSSGRVRYFGPTTNMNVLTHIPAGVPAADVDRRRRQHRPQAHWPVCLVVRDLSPETHDYLMQQYWTCYNSVLHLVHSDAFEHDLERGGTQFYSLFLHLAMLATGFRFADKTRHDVQRLAMAPGGRFGSTLQEKAVALAKLELDRSGGIPSIQAFGLLADVEFNSGRDESGWLLAGMSLRLVIDVGLHVDPSPLRLTVKEAQIRHMVLWACILHDMYWSLYLGRPTTLKPADIAPACLSKDFTRLICCRPSGHEKKLTTRIYEHLLQLMDLITPLCDRSTLSRPTRTTDIYFKMVALDEALSGWYVGLPQDLKWPTARPSMPSSYYLLHTQYHAAVILLHRPFVRYGSGPDDDRDPADSMDSMQPGTRPRFNNLSRSVCAEHADYIVSLFEEYRAHYDISLVFGTGLSHLGTAATALMGEAVLEVDVAKRGAVIAQLLSARQSISQTSGNYPPGHHMTRILDEFIGAVRHQHEAATPQWAPGGLGSGSSGPGRPYPCMASQSPSQPAPLHDPASNHAFSAALDEIYSQRQGHRPDYATQNGGPYKRQRVGNACTFTPTVPASPTLQGLPFVPSSFLESLDASDLVVFPESAGYSDYGFEWDPTDIAAI